MIAESALNASAELDDLLQETQADAMLRERTAFDRVLKESSGRVVIYGAGNLGRKILAGLRGAGTEVVAFADRNPSLWSQTVDGLRVLDPRDAAAAHGDNDMFVAAVWHPTRAVGVTGVLGDLRSIGCQNVTSFVPLFWRDAERYLPFYLWDLPSRALAVSDRIRAGFKLFEGDLESETLFLQQLRLRLHGTFECLAPPAAGEQYFPPFVQPLTDECFIDCGAFDGDTVRAFLGWNKGKFAKVVAFEPDPDNAGALRAFAKARPELVGRIEVRTDLIGDQTGQRRFNASGAADAALSDTGSLEVSGTTLDAALAGYAPTFIKMDIEGEELAALRGSRGIIAQNRPILAICAYHLQNHLWEVPLLMATLLDNARLGMVSHFRDGFDTVCYAVPQERHSKRDGVLR